MAKIIDINPKVISIGHPDGSIEEIEALSLNFVPHIGDEVEIFRADTRTIVSKVERRQENHGGSAPININMNNIQSVTAPQPVYQHGRIVNKVVYCVLAFCLGAIGVHKFYSGKIGMGILYLLFCWTGIPAFVALVEFVLALLKPADINGNIVV